MNKRPIFQDVFADQWDRLPAALKLHYANRPFTNDHVTVKGTLTITMGPLLRLLSPLLKAFGMLTPWPGENIPCTVTFLSEPTSDAFIFERTFNYPGKSPYIFRSKMIAQQAHEVIEYMACGIGWRSGYHFDGTRVRLTHKGYIWRLFGRDMPMPFFGEWLMGRGEAWEEATGDNRFKMDMRLTGSLLGNAMFYGYEGVFDVTDLGLSDD